MFDKVIVGLAAFALYQLLKSAQAKLILYHYTSRENAEAIRKKGVIYPSGRGAFGNNKVYLTSMKPSAGKKKLAQNNYDGMKNNYWWTREESGSVDDFIRVQVPESQVTRVNCGRNIYTYDGPLYL